jgi:thiamine pyrophosphate-dependent acetolactate synthase large subunit-like protein
MMIVKMADRRMRNDGERVYTGTTINNPNIDYAKIAQGFGLYGEGPVSDPKELAAAIRRGIEVVKRGEPAVIDIVSEGR